ncbi:actin-like ATPase domain-containing protein [Zalerion maritima]|uniref:Actin-like ATPase domain-containing protein n=1 Tax=Zalerion maritima TaxID=339359 RepID=A0AAD5WSU0_9PEZI|nr:actin-like ATPase domain-containing protein [Zalerion maritima]
MRFQTLSHWTIYCKLGIRAAYERHIFRDLSAEGDRCPARTAEPIFRQRYRVYNIEKTEESEDTNSEGSKSQISLKAASVVTEYYFQEVFKYTRALLEEEIPKPILDIARIHVWITKAVSGGDAQQSILKAAKRAAKKSEPAAMATLLDTSVDDDDMVKEDDGFLEIDQRFDLKQVTVAEDVKCGAALLDTQLHRLMESFFGDHLIGLGGDIKSPGSQFMRDWEERKRKFGRRKPSDGEDIFLLELHIEGVRDNAFYRDDGFVIHTESVQEASPLFEARTIWSNRPLMVRPAMGKFFDPVVNKILDVIQSQVNKAEAGNWGAISHGAVALGLEKAAVSSRRAQNHYGTLCSLPFEPGLDDEKDKFKLETLHEYYYDNYAMCETIVEFDLTTGDMKGLPVVKGHVGIDHKLEAGLADVGGNYCFQDQA